MDVITLSDKTQHFTLNCRNWMNNSNWDPWRGPIRFTQNTEIGFMFWKLGLKTNFPHNYWDIKRKIFLLWESRMRNVCCRSFIQSLGDIYNIFTKWFSFQEARGSSLTGSTDTWAWGNSINIQSFHPSLKDCSYQTFSQ